MDNTSKDESRDLKNVGIPAEDAELAIRYAYHDLEAWKRIYELCLELRNFEISQLVQRNNFFMIFQGVLLAGICQSAGQLPVVSFMVCLAGFVISMLQAGMASGAKYWQTHWEINTRISEHSVTRMLKVHGRISDKIQQDGVSIDPALLSQLERRKMLVHLFMEDSNRKLIAEHLSSGRKKRKIINWMIMQRFSTSRIPIYAGLALSMVWLTLLICTIHIDGLNLGVLDIIVGFPGKAP